MAIVNNAAMNTGCMYLFKSVFSFFFSDTYPALELLDHMVVLFFYIFEELPILFSIVAVQFFFNGHTCSFGISQARGWIGAVVASLYHTYSNNRSGPFLWPMPQLMATPDPLTHWARLGFEQVTLWILVRFLTCWATTGTP